MADAAASALVKVIFEKLADEALKQYVRSQGIHSELEDLGRELSRIQALLNDASHKEIKNVAVKQWLNDLQHVAYDIDDVLDDVATEAMHRELTPKSGVITSRVRKLIPTCCTKFSLSHRLCPKLDSITTRLQHLYKAKSDLGLVVKDEKQKDANRGNETSLLESSVIGRDGEKEKLLKKLLGDEPSNENFTIVPIVGMGGVGKTTLAKLLYNDTRVKNQFELQAWVCVSDEFDISKISKAMFQAVSGETQDSGDLNQIQTALKEKLKDKRFLLVLDDVWTENYAQWENLVLPFYSGARGSRVIMTTRKIQLLKKLGFDHLDYLKSLSHEDALSLFAIHAMGVDNFDSHPTLRSKGESIVEKCGALPLALKAIGRLLRTKAYVKDWDALLKSEIWDLENVDEIVPALRLSYHDLSTDLKRLFAYCSLFPKDFLFDKEELVLLWMAEGFLSPSNAAKSSERQYGHEYFEALLSRSFFQHAPNNESLFVMHDLMNDLATFVSGDSFLRFDNNMDMPKEALAKYRHMSFICEEYVAYPKFEAFKTAKGLRTFLPVSVGEDQSWQRFYLSNKILDDLLPHLLLLRVISLSRFNISEVPEFIGSLKHLRYLNLSQTKIRVLPEDVGNLYNLQTLIIFCCKELTKLPKSFLKLTKLRHLDIRDTPLLKELPLGIGELKNLQTLTKIIIGGDSGFAIQELKGLNNLCGELSIEGLCKVQSTMHAREAKLSSKGLTKLVLNWGDGFEHRAFEKEVLGELQPNSDTLKKLAILSYGGIEFPNWVGNPSFLDLVHVSIRGCGKCTYLPPLGQLPLLKELFIQGMSEVKSIGSELTGTTNVAFPSLEVLEFQDMAEWKVWSTKSESVNDVFPRLRKLHINNCPKLIEVSFETLPKLQILRFKDMPGWEVWANNSEALDVRFPCLRELHIENGPKLITVSFETLPKLQIIRFKDMPGWEVWATNREALDVVFPCLRELHIENGPKLIKVALETLPSLEVLRFKDMWGWEVWSTNNVVLDVVFPCLRELYIENCPKLMEVTVVAMPSVRVLEIHGCGQGVLRSLVEAASSITMLKINSISGLTYEVWRGVMKYLGAVEEVKIENCDEIRYLWESETEASKVLVNLKNLSVKWCNNLFSLGEKEEEEDNFGSNLLSSLRMLDLRGCYNMERCCCPNSTGIERLQLISCKSLTHVSFTSGGGQKLKELVIDDCEKLMEKINNTSMPMLEVVEIAGWRNLKSVTQLSNFLHLTDLVLQGCPGLESLPDIQLPNLARLLIENCQNMKSFPHIKLPSLTTLIITKCERLESFQLSHLTLLKRLVITGCPNIDASFHSGLWPPELIHLKTGGLKKPISEWGPQNFPTSLVNLTLCDEPHVSNFGQLSHLFPSSLIELGISRFDKLESFSMGLQHLTSLQHLIIENCPKMKRLPETLPPSLLHLSIYGCPHLSERCNGRGSHYWPLISHIPRINIY